MIHSLRLLHKYFWNKQPAKGPEKQDDFPMYIEPVDLIEYSNRLFAYPECFTKKTLKTIGYEDKEFNIHQLDFHGTEADKQLLIFGGVHGNETGALLAVPEIMKNIAEQKEHYKDWYIKIVSPVNPVGVAYQSRYNEHGLDVNRDFKHFRTVSARTQRDVIEEFDPDIIVSFHEGPHEKGMFMVTDYVNENLALSLLEALKQHNIELAHKSFLKQRLKTPGWWPKTRFLYWVVDKILGIYGLGWYINKHQKKTCVVTTEGSWVGSDLNERIRPHVVVVQGVAKHFERRTV